ARAAFGSGAVKRPRRDPATRQPPKVTEPNTFSIQVLPGDAGTARVVMTVYQGLRFKITVYDAVGNPVAQRTGVLALDGLMVCASPDDPARAMPVYFPVGDLCGLRGLAQTSAGGATARGRTPGPLGHQ